MIEGIVKAIEAAIKSHVKGHYRTLEGGKRVWVKPHEDKRTKRETAARVHASEAPVRNLTLRLILPEELRRYRNNPIIPYLESQSGGWKLEVDKTAGKQGRIDHATSRMRIAPDASVGELAALLSHAHYAWLAEEDEKLRTTFGTDSAIYIQYAQTGMWDEIGKKQGLGEGAGETAYAKTFEALAETGRMPKGVAEANPQFAEAIRKELKRSRDRRSLNAEMDLRTDPEIHKMKQRLQDASVEVQRYKRDHGKDSAKLEAAARKLWTAYSKELANRGIRDSAIVQEARDIGLQADRIVAGEKQIGELPDRRLRKRPDSWGRMGINYIRDSAESREAEGLAFRMFQELARLHRLDILSEKSRILRVRGGRCGNRKIARAVYFPGERLIEFRSNAQYTLPHEFGHFLDDVLFRGTGYKAVVVEAFQQTPEHRQWIQHIKKVWRSRNEYYADPDEIWARAYECWVYERLPKDSPLKKAMDFDLEKRAGTGEWQEKTCWLKESRRPVAALVDDCIKARIDVIRKALGVFLGIPVWKSQMELPFHLQGGMGSSHRGSKRRPGKKIIPIAVPKSRATHEMTYEEYLEHTKVDRQDPGALLNAAVAHEAAIRLALAQGQSVPKRVIENFGGQTRIELEDPIRVGGKVYLKATEMISSRGGKELLPESGPYVVSDVILEGGRLRYHYGHTQGGPEGAGFAPQGDVFKLSWRRAAPTTGAEKEAAVAELKAKLPALKERALNLLDEVRRIERAQTEVMHRTKYRMNPEWDKLHERWKEKQAELDKAKLDWMTAKQFVAKAEELLVPVAPAVEGRPVAEAQAATLVPQIKSKDDPAAAGWELSEEDYVERGITKEIRRLEGNIRYAKDQVAQLGPKATKKREEWEMMGDLWTKDLARVKAGDVERIKTNARREYGELVRQAIKKGKPVPLDVVKQRPEFVKASNARARYDKGWHTSFANRSIAVSEETKAERGYKVKRQDGKEITPVQVAEINQGMDEIESVLGPELRDLIRASDITIAHTSGKHPFLKGAGGCYTPTQKTVTTGVNDMLGRPIPSLAHEIGHWLDIEAGHAVGAKTYVGARRNRQVSTSLAEGKGEDNHLLRQALDRMNDRREARKVVKLTYADAKNDEEKAQIERVKLLVGLYWYSDREIWARLFAQYIRTKIGDDRPAVSVDRDYTRQIACWNAEDFNYLMPMVEVAIARRMSILKGSEVTIPGASPAAETTPERTPLTAEEADRMLERDYAEANSPEATQRRLAQMMEQKATKALKAGEITQAQFDAIRAKYFPGKKSLLIPVRKGQVALPFHLQGGTGSSHRGSKRRTGKRVMVRRTAQIAPTPGVSAAKIKRIISVEDTRQYEEQGDRWVPIPGSGTEHFCERCGKLHEVHATVELEDGSTMVVGTACMKAEDAEMARRFERADRAAKRLRMLEAERQKWQAKADERARAQAEVDALTPPEPVRITIKPRFESQSKGPLPGLQMSETKVAMWSHRWHPGDEPSARDWSELEQTALREWRHDQLKARGVNPHEGSALYRVQDIDKEIRKVKERLEQINEAVRKSIVRGHYQRRPTGGIIYIRPHQHCVHHPRHHVHPYARWHKGDKLRRVRICSKCGHIWHTGAVARKIEKAIPLKAGQRWITVHPHGEDEPGIPVLIQEHPDGTASVVAGAGGKLNYLRLTKLRSEEEWREMSTQRKLRREKILAERKAKLSKEEAAKESEFKEGVQQSKEMKDAEFVQTVMEAHGIKTEDWKLSDKVLEAMPKKSRHMAEKRHMRKMVKRAEEMVKQARSDILAAQDKIIEEAVGDLPGQDILPPAKETGTGAGYVAAVNRKAAENGLTPQEQRAEKHDISWRHFLDAADGDEVEAERKKAMVEMLHAALAEVREPVTQAARMGLLDVEVKPEQPKVEDIAKLLVAEKKHREFERQYEMVRRETEEQGVPKSAFLVAKEMTAEEIGAATLKELSDADAKDQVAKDLEMDRMQKVASRLLDVADEEQMKAPLKEHLGVGQYDSLNSAALAATKEPCPIDRVTADVLGPAAAADLLVEHFRRTMGPEELEAVKAGFENYHVKSQVEIAEKATGNYVRACEKMDAVEIPKVTDTESLMQAQMANDRKAELLAEGRRDLGVALGKLEGTAAMVEALQSESPPKELRVSLGAIANEQAVAQARAIGLQPGDYVIDSDGVNKYLTVQRSGINQLMKGADPEFAQKYRVAQAIKRGDYDEDGWLPAGIMARPATTFDDPHERAMMLTEPIQLKGKMSQGEMKDAIEDYIGARLADGQDPESLRQDVLSAEFVANCVPDTLRGKDAGGPYYQALKDLGFYSHEQLENLSGEKLDKWADAIVAKRRKKLGDSANVAALNSQSIPLSDATYEAVHRAMAKVPQAQVISKGIGELTPQDKGVLRDFFWKNLTDEKPPVAAETRARREKEGAEAEEVLGHQRTIFGETEEVTRGPKAETGEEETAWDRYVRSMGSTDRAYETVQDLARGHFMGEFGKELGRVTGSEIKTGTKRIPNWERHILGILSPERQAQLVGERAIEEKRKQAQVARRAAGKFAKEEAAGARRERAERLMRAMKQKQMALFTGVAAPTIERATIGHRAEGQLGKVFPIVAANFDPKKPVDIPSDVSMSGKYVPQQRAVKMFEAMGRMGLNLGVGSGKSLIALGAFTDLQSQGKVNRAIFAVPSAVCAQFGGEALRFCEPGKYKWFANPAASAEERRAAYGDASRQMVLVTHQALRDDLSWAVAQNRFGGDVDRANTFLAKASEDERKKAVTQAVKAQGWNFDMSVVDEGHDLLNRRGKPNSRMANAIDGLTSSTKFYSSMTADPIKNSPDEAFSMLHKMDPERYSDEKDFMSRYGIDTQATRDALQRELMPYSYTGGVTPGVKADRSVVNVELGEGERQGYADVLGLYRRAQQARRKGGVDVEALKTLSPDSFKGLNPKDAQAKARELSESLGMIRDAALDRIVNSGAKTAKVLEIVKSKRSGDGKQIPGLVFAHSLKAVREIKDTLTKAGVRVATLTGENSSAEKENARLKFQPGGGQKPQADVLLCSDAGSIGINAQRGAWEINVDTPYTAKTHEQRFGRINRLGQKQNVEMIDLVTSTPYEKRRREILRNKAVLRDIFTSPTENIDDTGLAHEIWQARQAELERDVVAGAVAGAAKSLGALNRHALEADLLEKAYDPNEPRVPKGRATGGRWTYTEGGEPTGEQEHALLVRQARRTRKRAMKFLPDLERVARETAALVDARYLPVQAKRVSSIVKKVLRKRAAGLDCNPRKVSDLIRTAIVLKNWEDAPRVVEHLAKMGAKLDVKVSRPMTKMGYRGIHCNINFAPGITGEIQVSTEETWPVKVQTDPLYDKWRDEKVKNLDRERRREYRQDTHTIRAAFDEQFRALDSALT